MDTRCQAVRLTTFEVIFIRKLLQNIMSPIVGLCVQHGSISMYCSPQQTDWVALKRLRLHDITRVMLMIMLCYHVHPYSSAETYTADQTRYITCEREVCCIYNCVCVFICTIMSNLRIIIERLQPWTKQRPLFVMACTMYVRIQLHVIVVPHSLRVVAKATDKPCSQALIYKHLSPGQTS